MEMINQPRFYVETDELSTADKVMEFCGILLQTQTKQVIREIEQTP